MTRISDRLLVQRVDEVIVVLDESTGAEVVFPIEQVPQVIEAMAYLANPEGQARPRPLDIRAVVVNVEADLARWRAEGGL